MILPPLLNIHHSEDTGLGLSPDLWRPFSEAGYSGRRLGQWLADDCDGAIPIEAYVATQATAGTAAFIDGDGGILELDCGSSTTRQGINVQFGDAEMILPSAARILIFECRVNVSDVGSGLQTFLGLAVTDTSIIATDAMSTDNHIGFFCANSTGVLAFTGEKATVAGTVAAVHTFVEDTYVKLGFIAKGNTITVYINGSPFATTLALATYLPLTELRPSFVCHSHGVDDPIVNMDWWACANLYG